MAHRRTLRLVRTGVVVASLSVLVSLPLTPLGHPADASQKPADPVHVHFVLTPTWLPSGFSTTGGGWVKGAGGLAVYPHTGVGASRYTVGSQGQVSIPVLFTLNYFGFHSSSKRIRLTATPGSTPALPPPFVVLGQRHVALIASTQGALHNMVTNSSWTEKGDQVMLSTEGLTTAQVDQFIRGLAERKPPHN